MTTDVKGISGRSFDYIIVGGGTSGCALAATLSEKFSVLLVERGGSPFGNPLVEEKNNFGFPLIETDEFSSIAQAFVSEDGVANHRGRVLGGSSAINGGFYSRASEHDVERIGWDRELVKESYEWVESKIVFEPQRLTPWQSVANASYIEGKVLPYNAFSLEHIEGTKIGGSIFDNNGKRHTSADLLRAGNLKNLAVLVNATVTNVIFHDHGRQKPRAIGIRFMDSNGDPTELHQVYLNKSGYWGDVILSAGALGSPQILMLSGIGPEQHLKRFNIKPLVHHPQVGKNFQDMPAIALLFNISHRLQKLPTDPPQVVGIADKFQFIIQSIILPSSPTSKIFPITAKLAKSESEGVLELESTDPRKNPYVRFNYLADQRDLRKCVRMTWLINRIAQSKPVEEFTGRRQEGFDLGGGDVRRKLMDICRKKVRTFYHYHGGCVVGSVVDKEYRVYGVSGLRVVDGSTLSISPGTNPMATLLMLGRYQGRKIINERRE
ncbi:(R)-mandelonitrile lyase-like [Aristolochia californica]|uniref:(R)-mandelonitrile lyase-like n=1 Tax=Aristolochia californica TaxID=171875 RepID=UPI0035DE19FC